MSSIDEQVIAYSILHKLGCYEYSKQIGRLSVDHVQSDVLRKLLPVADSCRTVGETDMVQVVLAYSAAGGDDSALIEFAEHDGIILPKSLAASIDRVIARSLAVGFYAAVAEYEIGAITLEDLLAVVAGVDEEFPEQAVLLSEAIREYESGEVLPGVDVGFSKLDGRLKGLKRGRVTIMASRPGVGKSDLALSFACNVLRRGCDVFIASVEMDRTEILQRMERSERGLDNLKGFLGTMHIDDRGKISVPQIAAATMAMKPELVIVDYLQILRPTQKTGGMYEKVSVLSDQLRSAAKHSGAAWLVLSQLSRNAKDEQHYPTLSDLRDSGAIEQDAYAVAFMYEPTAREYDGDSGHEKPMRRVEMIVAKNRGGACGRMSFEFMPAASQWRQL